MKSGGRGFIIRDHLAEVVAVGVGNLAHITDLTQADATVLSGLGFVLCWAVIKLLNLNNILACLKPFNKIRWGCSPHVDPKKKADATDVTNIGNFGHILIPKLNM